MRCSTGGRSLTLDAAPCRHTFAKVAGVRTNFFSSAVEIFMYKYVGVGVLNSERRTTN